MALFYEIRFSYDGLDDCKRYADYYTMFDDMSLEESDEENMSFEFDNVDLNVKK